MRRRETIIFVLILLAATYASQYFVAHPQASSQKTSVSAERTRLLALVGALQAPLHLDAQEKDSSCVVQGPLPDHSCSPGSVFLGVPVATICQSGYTKTVRNVSVKLKKQIYANYGISYPEPSGSYELDHLVPLELGGDNTAENLFPEAASPAPGFHEKDVVENYLHESVCAGDISLAAAQEQIADNWVAVYDLLSSSTVSQLEEKYKNWAD
jgi:hypothetical protein